MRHFVVVSPVLAEFSRGEVVTGDQLASSDEGLDRTVARGWAIEIEPAAETTVVVADSVEPSTTTEPADRKFDDDEAFVGEPERPARNASRVDWVAYANLHGVDPDDLTRDEIAGLFIDES